MKKTIDKEKIRILLEEVNVKLVLLEMERKKNERQKILDYLLVEKNSPLKILAKLFDIDI